MVAIIKNLTEQQSADVELLLSLPEDQRKQVMCYVQGLLANPIATKAD